MLSALAMHPVIDTHPADDVPPPDRISIGVVNANGSGCPAGSAQVAISDDKTAFTVTYSHYLAQVGVGAGPTDFPKNCQLGLNVHIPQGYTFAVSESDYRGFAHLERGASGTESAHYYFQGDAQTAAVTHPFAGGTDGDWQTTDLVPIEARVFMRCGTQRNLNINTELRVSAGRSDTRNTTSFLNMDSTDGSINTIYHFAWKRCVQ
jgi:hypothetical protein